MSLSIPERLKDLRAERGLTLEQLAEQTHLPKSALGSYEADDFKDISHYALIQAGEVLRRGGEAGAGRKRHSRHHESNDYEAVQSRVDRPAVKTACHRPH